MGVLGNAPTALRFYAVTVNDPALFTEAERLILGSDKTILCELGPFEFSRLTSYYEKEMGSLLYKKFLLLNTAVSLENAHRAKIESNDWEKQFMTDRRRAVNIDPGFLTLFNFSLLTTKGFSHRIYLAEGIWSELTLVFHNGNFVVQPWTYPDYKTNEALDFFTKWRTYAK